MSVQASSEPKLSDQTGGYAEVKQWALWKIANCQNALSTSDYPERKSDALRGEIRALKELMSKAEAKPNE